MAKVITSTKVKFNYVNVFTPTSFNGSEPKYSVSLIISKDDKETVSKIKKAIENAFKEGISILKGKEKSVSSINAIKTPLHDGDIERPDDSAYENCYFMNATCKSKPEVVDRNLEPIINPEEFYSGCYGRASVNLYAYNANGNKGIACGLNNLQKIKDGDRFGGKSSAADDFSVYTEDVNDDFLG